MHDRWVQHRAVRQDANLNAHAIDPTTRCVFDSDLDCSDDSCYLLGVDRIANRRPAKASHLEPHRELLMRSLVDLDLLCFVPKAWAGDEHIIAAGLQVRQKLAALVGREVLCWAPGPELDLDFGFGDGCARWVNDNNLKGPGFRVRLRL